jgi:carbon-monoxide dehydrogenase large subunit
MSSFGKSQNVLRVEDLRFLTGQGRYVDDIAPVGALQAVFVRAQVAHADLGAIDTAAAQGAPGVRLVLTGDDLVAAGLDLDMNAAVVKNRDGSDGARSYRPVLAQGRVRFVGEPVAMVVADTLEQARDAAELVAVAYAERPAHLALAPGGDALHDTAPDNIAFDWGMGDAETVEAALATSAHRVRLRIEDNRIIVNSMEPRGAFAEWDGARLHLAVNGQGVWDQKSALARSLRLRPEDVRVTNPDVGGGFGMKGMCYPEYVVIAQAARVLGRPVRWMSDRGEAMLTDNAGRDLVSETEIGFDADFRITAYRVDTLANLGAYNSQFGQNIQTNLFAKVLTGLYDIGLASARARGVFTNTTQVDAYRGAGRPEAIYALERTMDNAARVLGVDPWELRRRNFIAPGAFPYRTASGELYDVGDFARVLDRVRAEADVPGLPARKAASGAAGRLRGQGLCCYIESILGSPTESAAVEFHEDGTVSLYVGTQSNGQGHETVFAQFLADRTGLPFDAIRVVQGDSDRIAKGGGTGGSRSVTVQGNATLAAVSTMIDALRPFVADELGVAPDAVAFEDGAFRAEGSNRTPDLLEVAAMVRAAGRPDLLRHDAEATLPGRSYPNGAHVAEVEIDPETGIVRLDRYTITDDFGNLIHPTLAMGQVHGGVAQGFGQAVTERVAHDAQGQLLSASFMDYALPRADDLPMFAITFEPVPSTANPLGMKGCGEAGTVGAMAAVANAVQDALAGAGVGHVDMPFTPERVWRALQDARADRAA